VATPSPVTTEQLLARMRKSLSAEEQTELAFYLSAATEAAEGWKDTGWIITRAFTERVHTNANGNLELSYKPVVSITTATSVSDGTVYVTADVVADPWSGIVELLDWRFPAGWYDVAGTAGRGTIATVPDGLKMAVMIIAEHNWRVKMGPPSRGFRGPGTTPEGEYAAPNGFLIPRAAAGYLRSAGAAPFQVG
jgi:hypothetical protein